MNILCYAVISSRLDIFIDKPGVNPGLVEGKEANEMLNKTMYRTLLQLVVAISLGTFMAISSAAEQKRVVTDVPAGKPAAIMPNITYKPPLLDDAADQTAVSTKGMQGKTVILQVLAPDHTGLTMQAQPTLYWTMRSKAAIHFAITEIADGAKPILEAEIEKGPGIQQLDLSRHDISLKPGTRYRWSVTQVVKEGSKSTDVIASGVIERIKPGEGLSSRIKRVRGVALVDVYAIEGIWYDALQTISSMIDETPEDQNLSAIRQSLLNQVGVNKVALY